MGASLILIFNHRLTQEQDADARVSLGVEQIIRMPKELEEIWRDIPPDAREISSYIAPVKRWLLSVGKRGDFVVIQGDFGACYLLVAIALKHGLVPVYSTTLRIAGEDLQPDGSVKLTHRFQHRIFRRYGA